MYPSLSHPVRVPRDRRCAMMMHDHDRVTLALARRDTEAIGEIGST